LRKFKHMKKTIFPAATAAVFLLCAFTTFNATQWNIAQGYSIKFTSPDPSGVFTSLKGSVVFDENNPGASKFDVTVDVASINTGNGTMNKHAKSAKWFDAENYPFIKFTSSKISKTSNGYEVTGTMEIHGIQKEITFPFTFSNNTFIASFDVNRLDYKVGTNEGMQSHAQTTLKIDLSVPVTQ
jgi:polyisoprenoid-binding protein YceI